MIQKFFAIIILVVLLISISGCDIYEVSDHSQEPMYAPIEIKMKIDQEQYNKNGDNKAEDIKIDINFDFLNLKWNYPLKSRSAKIIIETDDIVKVKGSKEYYYPNVKKITNKTIPIEVVIPYDTEEHGEMWARLYTYDENGDELYYKGSAIYYSIKDEEILLGINGTSELRYKHLDNLLERGEIDIAQHRNALEEISREGAMISWGQYSGLTKEKIMNGEQNYISGSSKCFEGYFFQEIWLEKGTFVLDFKEETEEGKILLKLLDKEKNELLKVSKSEKDITVDIEKTGKYTLRVIGDNHVGHFEFEWKSIE